MKAPSAVQIEEQASKLSDRISKTPVHLWDTPFQEKLLGKTKPFFKLELLQKTGSFKVRGALTVLDHLSDKEKARGVVAGTGGNHGIAVAYAAKNAVVSAKIIVPKSINPFRLNAIKQIGPEIEQIDSISQILDEMNRVAKEENRTVMHPFENPFVTLGTATLGWEFMQQAPDLDAVIVPIGGGGLASGVACAVKQINPKCKVYGVEPVGANTMRLSIDRKKPVSLENGPKSIADSLCAPRAEPYSFSVCQKYLDDVVLIEDDEMRNAMRVLFSDLKLVTEPAGAAATAALLGPLKEKCSQLNVGIIACGSNIDLQTFQKLAKA